MIVLTAVTVFAGLVLALANSAFAERIDANRREAFERSLSQVFPDSENATFERLLVDGSPTYKATTRDSIVLGYAVTVESPGYGGTITLLVGLAPDLKTVEGLAIVENVETPGLGGRIEEEWFRRQFAGLDPTRGINYVKNRAPNTTANEVEAISGATISTRAVLAGINATLGEAAETIRAHGAGAETAQ